MQALLHYTWTKAQNSHLEFAFQFLQTWCSQGETRVIQEGKAELSPALQQEPEELKWQQINPMGWNHVGTQTFGNSTSDPYCKPRLPRTPERRWHKLRWENICCPPLGQKCIHETGISGFKWVRTLNSLLCRTSAPKSSGAPAEF